MNQSILIFFCLLFVGLVFGAPAGDEKIHSTIKPFTAEDCAKGVEDDTESACRALIPVYKWSIEEQDCVITYYGGCDATANNFIYKNDCREVAKPICQTVKN